MKLRILPFLFLWINFVVLSQVQQTNKLKRFTGNVKSDTALCRTLLNLGDKYVLEKPDSAAVFYEEVKSISEKFKEKVTDEKLNGQYLNFYATALNNLAAVYVDEGQVALSIKYCNEALDIYTKINDKSGIASACGNLGYIYAQQAEVGKALDYFKRSLELLKEINDKKGTAQLLDNIGLVYLNQGDVPNALEYLRQALKLAEKEKLISEQAKALNSIATVFMQQGEIPKALEYMTQILELYTKVKDNHGIAESLNNLGFIYDKQGNYDKALEYHFKSLKVREEMKDIRGAAISYDNIGYVYENKGDLKKALEYYMKNVSIREEMNDKYGLVTVFNNLSSFFRRRNILDKAKFYAEKSLELAKELGYPENIKNAAGALKAIYEKQNNYKEALKMYELSMLMKDSMNSEKSRKAGIRQQFQMEYEKQSVKDSLENVAKLKEEELKHTQAIAQQRTYTYGGFTGLFLMLIIAVISFRAYRSKQKANVIITEQKKFVEMQKYIIEEKQKEIIDSIYYAKRIQKAHLPQEKYISKKIKELKDKGV